MEAKIVRLAIIAVSILVCLCGSVGAKDGLVLQEMTWPDVKAYLESSDMVIIPLGSTEQHGPHLPLGTDTFEALEISRQISARTGVVVAPVLTVGYSIYHGGFPGTLSICPETMEQVLFETVETLIGHGFRRIMFFNYHGGNNIVQAKVIHRINHGTEAVAVAIGHGGPIQVESDDDGKMDWHAGQGETSIMLHLRPDLVRNDRIEKPEMNFTPRMQELKRLAEKGPSLVHVWSSLFGVPAETGKGGASDELSSTGVWTLGDPGEATAEQGRETVSGFLERAVDFIQAWQQATLN